MYMRSFVLPIFIFRSKYYYVTHGKMGNSFFLKIFVPANSRWYAKIRVYMVSFYKYIEIVVILSNIGRSSHRILDPT